MSDATMIFITCAGLAGINALGRLQAGLSERRWTYIGDQGAWCFRRTWLNLALSAAFALVPAFWRYA